MKKIAVSVVVAALALSGCVPSVNPFYTDRDVVFDARLLGEWRAMEQSEGTEVWKFEKLSNTAYRLTLAGEDSKQGQFEAHLFKLKQNYFLDLVPSDCQFATNQADLVAWAMFPGHLLLRVPQMEPTLKLAFFDFDWLEKHLKKNPKVLAHRRQEDRLILTAETRDLQHFVLKHLREGELFQKPGELVHTTSASAPGR